MKKLTGTVLLSLTLLAPTIAPTQAFAFSPAFLYFAGIKARQAQHCASLNSDLLGAIREEDWNRADKISDKLSAAGCLSVFP